MTPGKLKGGDCNHLMGGCHQLVSVLLSFPIRGWFTRGGGGGHCLFEGRYPPVGGGTRSGKGYRLWTECRRAVAVSSKQC